MQLEILDYERLTPELRARWLEFLSEDPERSSPYYRPEFCDAVAASREGLKLALFSDAQGLCAILPFEQQGSVLTPAGFSMNDYEGPICRAGVVPDPRQLLRAAGASSFEFLHLYPVDAPHWGTQVLRSYQSPQMDVRDGLDAYKARLAKSGGSSELSSTLRKGRKMGREVGELRFELDDRDPGLMDRLIEWKRVQYLATGAEDAFNAPWRRQMLESIQACREPAFRGLMASLYAGDRLVALHYYLQSGPVLHSWFPVYDEDLSRYSPGRVLLARTVECAPDYGLETIDLGKGEVTYKLRAMTHSVVVGEGVVDLRPWRAWLRRAQIRSVDTVKSWAIYDWLRQLKRRLGR